MYRHAGDLFPPVGRSRLADRFLFPSSFAAMNDFLKDRILRRLEPLSDERLYQVLDYIEFLESKYAEHKPAPPNVFQRFAEGVEDTLRAGKVSASTVAETMGLLSKAMGLLGGVAAAGRSVASDIVGSATGSSAAQPPAAQPPVARPAAPASPPGDPPRAQPEDGTSGTP